MSKFFSLFSEIITKLNSKASLVDGKVPLSQLPDNIGGDGDEPVKISAVLNVETLELSELSHYYEDIEALIGEGKNFEFWCLSSYSDSETAWCIGDLLYSDDSKFVFQINSPVASNGYPYSYLIFIYKNRVSVRQQSESSGGEDEVVWVTGVIDLSTLQVSAMSHTYAELLELINAGKMVKSLVDYTAGVCYGDLAVYNRYQALIVFQVMLQGDFGFGNALHYLNVSINPDNFIKVTPYIVETMDLGS